MEKKVMDEKNKTVLQDEEMDKVTGGFGANDEEGYLDAPLMFSPSGRTKNYCDGSYGFIWERCNNESTPICGPHKCLVHGTHKCVNGWFLRDK